MTILADLVMIAFIPAALALFMVLRPRRAVIATLIVGMLLLPMAQYSVQGVPAYTKFSATSIALLLGVFIFDSGRVASFRPRLLDLPMVVWCLSPFVSSVTNELGAYDGLSAIADQVLIWGAPYFVARLYFGDRDGLRELALGIIIGGLIYVPLCLWEIRMSPQLHATLYGFHQHDFSQTYRLGGWRPTVFMQHGLAVGMFMTVASLLAIWLWHTGAVRRLMGVPMVWVVLPLAGTAVLCKSTGALLLLAAGVGALFAASMLKSRLVLVLLLIPPLLYMTGRSTMGWSGMDLVETAKLMGEDRAQSLETRVFHETLLIDKALERPAFGWGRWGRNRITDEHGRNQSITDGLWIITLGTMGLVGLAAMVGWMLGPPLVVFLRIPAVGTAATAAPVAMAVAMSLYVSDAIMNAMVNQFWVAIPGALVSALALSAKAKKSTVRARVARRRAGLQLREVGRYA
jgi:hypothetical protein